MSNPDNSSTERLLQELLSKVNNTLTEDVNVLKAKDGRKTYPQKCLCNGDSEGNGGHDGDNTVDRDGDFLDEENIRGGWKQWLPYHPISTFCPISTF